MDAPARTTAQTTRAPERLPLLPWRDVVVPWLVSRVYSVALIVGLASIGHSGVRATGFAKWDGQWYLAIARFGYGPEPVEGVQTRWPFFPGFPGLIHGIREIALPDRGDVGSVAVIDVGPDDVGRGRPVDAHGMDPATVLASLVALGGSPPARTLVVGCQIADTGDGMGLTQPVAAAVDEAVRTVRDLVVHDLQTTEVA